MVPVKIMVQLTPYWLGHRVSARPAHVAYACAGVHGAETGTL
jgi:hypothetical protein